MDIGIVIALIAISMGNNPRTQIHNTAIYTSSYNHSYTKKKKILTL